MQAKLSLKRYILLALVFFCWLNHDLKAQEDQGWVYDPKGKSDLWEQLSENPTDSLLWSKYYGKSWEEMNAKDEEKINIWKQQLMLQKLAENKAIVGFNMASEEDFFIDEQAFNEYQKLIEEAAQNNAAPETISFADIKGLEAVIVPVREGMEELKENVKQNFIILEDMYNDMFQENGLEYTYYKDKYPDESYSQNKWIEDHDALLNAHRQKQIEEIKKKYQLKNE
jgi:hypothetical protein